MRTVAEFGHRSARRLRSRRGQGVVEYALILAAASVGIVMALLILRDSLGGTLAGTSARIDAAATANALPGGADGEPSTGNPSTGSPSGGDDDGGGQGHGQHGNGKGNSGNGNGNGGPNGRKN